MTIFGDGTQQRAFTHIDDVAPIIAASVDFLAARKDAMVAARPDATEIGLRPYRPEPAAGLTNPDRYAMKLL